MSLEEHAEYLRSHIDEIAPKQELVPVHCDCGHTIFDGEAIRARCVKPAEGLALCRCKRWIDVPVQLVQ